jgi:hypothetical protein
MNKPRPEITLQSLGLSEIREALEMEDEEVGFHIESAMIKVASTILQGQGYSVCFSSDNTTSCRWAALNICFNECILVILFPDGSV